MMRLTNPPFGDGTGKVSHTKGRASTRRSGARPRIGSRVRPRRRRASDGRLRKRSSAASSATSPAKSTRPYVGQSRQPRRQRHKPNKIFHSQS